MKLHLISFSLCPYVQRVLATLIEKKAEFKITYIDLDNKPNWFLKISPRSKVPVLLVDEYPLFESQAICEFLDEIYPNPRLMPKTAIERARDRAWFTYVTQELNPTLFDVIYAKEESKLSQGKIKLSEKLKQIEEELINKKYLSGNGEHFGMADIRISSFLARAKQLERLKLLNPLAKFPNIDCLATVILQKQSVIQSWPANFDKIAYERYVNKNTWLVAHPEI